MIDKVLLWGSTFMPEYLRDLSPEFHRDLIAFFFSNKNEYTAAPRGFSKTTIIQLCLCFSVANRLDRFIPVIEKTWFEASEVISVVGDVFKTPMVVRVYGYKVRIDEGGEVDDAAREARGDLMINGVRLRGKGFNTSIRGLKSKAYRPTRIVMDDVEEDEHIDNSEQREKYFRNYTKGIIPALDINAHIKMYGTILHKDSLLNTMITSHSGHIYEAWNRSSGKPPSESLLWADRWTYERLLEKKKEMEADNKPSSAFWQEYFNDPISEEDRKFKTDWLNKRWKPDDLKFKPTSTYVTIDAADSKKEGSDFTGVVVVKIDSEGNWYISRVNRVKKDNLGLVEMFFELWQNEKPVVIGVEKKSFEDQFDGMINEKKNELQIYPVIRELHHHGTHKETRILGALQGRFESGKIFFLENSKDDQHHLIQELYDFPKARWDDLCDALAYIEQIAQKPSEIRPKKKFKGNFTYGR